MSDFYTSIAKSSVGRKLLTAVNLPVPATLERYTGDNLFVSGNLLLGAAPGGKMLDVVANLVADSTLKVKVLDKSDTIDAVTKAIKGAKLEISSVTPSQEGDISKYRALVFDATGIETTKDLRTLYDFFHPVVRKLNSNSRIVIIGRTPESSTSVGQATAQRALEGFNRSLAKEVGKKGSTTQVIYVETGAEALADPAIRFFLSPKSAYVTAQVLRISKAKLNRKKIDWSKPLEGKVALVTGASRGIGASIAEILARDGAKVICLDVPQAEEDLKKVAAKVGGTTIAVDITDPDAPKKIADTLKNDFGGADIIVHNAGVTRDKTLGGMPEHLWDMVIDINLSSEERINDALLEADAINKGGRIICVSSISGIAGNFGQTNYGTSKAGVIGYVQAMTKPLSEKEITINAVAPGFIETQMTAAMPFATREVGRRLNSLSQGGLPQDVAETIAFYANPCGNGVKGNIVRVCGQMLIGA